MFTRQGTVTFVIAAITLVTVAGLLTGAVLSVYSGSTAAITSAFGLSGTGLGALASMLVSTRSESSGSTASPSTSPAAQTTMAVQATVSTEGDAL